MRISTNHNSLVCEQPSRPRCRTITQCSGRISANARPLQLRWGDRECGCFTPCRWLALLSRPCLAATGSACLHHPDWQVQEATTVTAPAMVTTRVMRKAASFIVVCTCICRAQRIAPKSCYNFFQKNSTHVHYHVHCMWYVHVHAMYRVNETWYVVCTCHVWSK